MRRIRRYGVYVAPEAGGELARFGASWLGWDAATGEEVVHPRIDGLEINREEYMVYIDGKPINLPKKEFELLLFLATQPGKVFSRATLLEKVWGSNVHVVDRTIDVHVRKLREKIGKDWIKTVQGVGYKFKTKS